MSDDDRSESRPSGGPRRPGGPVRPFGRAAQRPGATAGRRSDDEDARRSATGRPPSSKGVAADDPLNDPDSDSDIDADVDDVVEVDELVDDDADAPERARGPRRRPDVDAGIPPAAPAVDDELVPVDVDAVAEIDGDLPDIASLDDVDELRAVAAFLREELVATRIERDELRDTLLRLKAEFDNFRKRTLKEQSEISTVVAVGLVEQILPALDSFDSAVKNPPEELDEDDLFVDGVRAVRAQLLDLLGKEGLERIDPDPEEGEEFDPNVHEAVASVPGDGPGQTVSRVFRPGYALNGRLIRPAMVEVSG